jgi:hypothetical protein
MALPFFFVYTDQLHEMLRKENQRQTKGTEEICAILLSYEEDVKSSAPAISNLLR